MSNTTPKYSPEQLKSLFNNPNVLDVKNASSIVFNPEFKILAVEQFKTGKVTCRQIFEQAGFDTTMFHNRYPQKQISRWRKVYDIEGNKAFTNAAGNLVNYRINYDVNKPEDVNYMLKTLEKTLISQQIELDRLKSEIRGLPRRHKK